MYFTRLSPLFCCREVQIEGDVSFLGCFVLRKMCVKYHFVLRKMCVKCGFVLRKMCENTLVVLRKMCYNRGEIN